MPPQVLRGVRGAIVDRAADIQQPIAHKLRTSAAGRPAALVIPALRQRQKPLGMRDQPLPELRHFLRPGATPPGPMARASATVDLTSSLSLLLRGFIPRTLVRARHLHSGLARDSADQGRGASTSHPPVHNSLSRTERGISPDVADPVLILTSTVAAVWAALAGVTEDRPPVGRRRRRRYRWRGRSRGGADAVATAQTRLAQVIGTWPPRTMYQSCPVFPYLLYVWE